MSQPVYVEYTGLTKEAAALVEQFRKAPDETKSDILIRVLRPRTAPSTSTSGAALDLGQGAKVYEGEELLLFLSDGAKRAFEPHARAEVRRDGLYVEGKRVLPSRGSLLQPPMRHAQERLNHKNKRGEVISLNAWRQWHVLRDGQLTPLVELKDPALARKRGRSRSLHTDKTAAELGL